MLMKLETAVAIATRLFPTKDGFAVRQENNGQYLYLDFNCYLRQFIGIEEVAGLTGDSIEPRLLYMKRHMLISMKAEIERKLDELYTGHRPY